MWREITVDDINGIDKLVALYTNRLDCTDQMDKTRIEKVLMTKRDAQYYLFEGVYVKLLMGIKHDIRDDTTYIFSINSDVYISEIGNSLKENELWDAYQLIVKLLLTKYDRKVKLVKWGEDKRIQYIIDMAVGFYAAYGIIAVNEEEHWIFELM